MLIRIYLPAVLLIFFFLNCFPWGIYLTKNIIDNKKDKFNIIENNSNNKDNKSDNDNINNPPNLKKGERDIRSNVSMKNFNDRKCK